ncbi:MAG: zinc ribbon domain-containing protein [Caldilineaceae bacterium]|nr:zinc ribbon domain-containing protein [Caldilineaceae bacterium]
MPLFEFKCVECGTIFEQLVRSTRTPQAIVCPTCRSNKTEKLLSGFAVVGGGATTMSAGADCAPGGT